MIISVSITASSEQIVSGIPRYLTIDTNIPATIFYSIDGSDPTINSLIYIGPLELPTNQLTLVVKVFATDGTNTSPIITNTYQTPFNEGDLRTPHSGTDIQAQYSPIGDLYPFGTSPIQPQGNYLGTGAAGLNVYDPSLPATPSGFNADGLPDGYTNEPLIGIPTQTQPIILSETDVEGQMGDGIGTLPKKIIVEEAAPPEQVFVGNTLFDPRASVIYFDGTKPDDLTQPPFINRMHFTLEDVNKVRQGNQYFNTALDAPPVSGTFLRQHYNPKDNTMNYYYLDTWQLRWIIAKIPNPGNAISNYWGSVVSGASSSKVFQWKLFKANYLY